MMTTNQFKQLAQYLTNFDHISTLSTADAIDVARAVLSGIAYISTTTNADEVILKGVVVQANRYLNRLAAEIVALPEQPD